MTSGLPITRPLRAIYSAMFPKEVLDNDDYVLIMRAGRGDSLKRDQPHHDHNQPHKMLLEEVERRQRNTVWPDPLVNSRAVDEYLWKGNPTAPLVQRIGAVVFGCAYLLAGAALALTTIEHHLYPALVISVVGWLVAGKMFMNAFNRKRVSRNRR
jgi:hypothetical protein